MLFFFIDDDISDSFTSYEALGFVMDVDEDIDPDEQKTEESTKFGMSPSIVVFLSSSLF